MTGNIRHILYFVIMAALFLVVGWTQSWSVSLSILNLCLVSAIMALGVNMQWGYAGLFNVGIMGFAALGGMAGILVSKEPVLDAWSAGGLNLLLALVVLLITIGLILHLRSKITKPGMRNLVSFFVVIFGFFIIRLFFDPAVEAIEAVNAAKEGYLGGIGAPILVSWLVGGILAAGAAWIVGKIALGLRADYLAIATLGIAEIIIAVLKNEDWLTEGLKT